MKRTIALLFMASVASADCTVAQVLTQIRPGAQWTMDNNDPAKLNWISTDSVKPTLAEIQAGVSDCPNQINLQQRNFALSDLTTAKDDRAKLERAVLLTLFDENNVMREWIQAFKGQVALATSLADLKTRIATLSDMPDRTIQQAQTAVSNKLNSGSSD